MSVVMNTPILPYHDPEAAARWLCDAYGFSVDRIVRDDDGEPSYISLKLGQSFVLVSPSSSPLLAEFGVRPDGSGQNATQTCYVHIDDVDAHCAEARSAGAEIALSPEADEDGAKFYVSRDPGRHLWIFGTRQFVEPQPSRRTSRLAWVAGALVAACVALLASVVWLNPVGVTDRAATVFNISSAGPGALSARAVKLIDAERQQREQAERVATEARDRRAHAEQRAKQEEKKRLAAERRIGEETEKRAITEHLLAEEQAKRATAEHLAAEAENKRIATTQSAERLRAKWASAKRLATEDKGKRAEAERLAEEARAQRERAERLAAEALAKRAAAERLASDAANKRDVAEEALRSVTEKLARANAEQERLKQTLARLDDAKVRDGQRTSSVRRRRLATILSLRTSLAALHKRLSEKETALAGISAGQSAARAALDEVRVKLDATQAKIAEKTRVLARERDAQAKLKARLDQMLKDVASLKEEKGRLENELARANAALNVAAKPRVPEQPTSHPAGPDIVRVRAVPPTPEKNTLKKPTRSVTTQPAEKPTETLATDRPSPAILDSKCKRVAWSRLFDKRPGTLESKLKTLRRLCQRAEASDGPVRCVGLMMRNRLKGVSPSLMQPRLSIESMVSLCGGTYNPRKTVRCYFRRRASGQSVSVAIDRCQDYAAIFRWHTHKG